MKARDVLNNIKNDEGSGYWKVFLPTMNVELRIKQLSINDQKIISKLSISNESLHFASESDLSKIALAETNSLENIDLTNIDIRDYFILLCAMRKENYLEGLKLNYSCPDCGNEFVLDIDFEKLIETAMEYEISTTEKTIPTDKVGDIKIEIGLPKQLHLIMMELYYNKLAGIREIAATERYIDYLICSIKTIKVQDEDNNFVEVEDFEKMDYVDRLEFINEIQPKIESLIEIFNEIGVITAEFFYTDNCPKCKSEISTFMDTSDFFIL